MDGTIVDSTAVVDRLWRAWAVRHELEPNRVLALTHGRQAYTTISLFLSGMSEAEVVRESTEMLQRETLDTDGIREVQGAGEFLRALGTAAHALVTSASEPLARARMRAADLPMPDVLVTSESVTASKPAPDGFLAAAATLGVEPADCIVFEDSAAGVESARRAGMRVIGVGASDAARSADWTVSDLSAVGIEVFDDGTVSIDIHSL